MYWLSEFSKPVHVVHYERLKADLAGELRKLHAFLNLEVDESSIQCTVQNSEGKFHRMHPKNDSDRFTADMKESLFKLETQIESLETKMK